MLSLLDMKEVSIKPSSDDFAVKSSAVRTSTRGLDQAQKQRLLPNVLATWSWLQRGKSVSQPEGRLTNRGPGEEQEAAAEWMKEWKPQPVAPPPQQWSTSLVEQPARNGTHNLTCAGVKRPNWGSGRGTGSDVSRLLRHSYYSRYYSAL